MKECPNCGAQVDDAAAVCRYCAVPLDGSSPVHTDSFAPQPPRAPEPPPYNPAPPEQARVDLRKPQQEQPYRQPYQAPSHQQAPPAYGQTYGPGAQPQYGQGQPSQHPAGQPPYSQGQPPYSQGQPPYNQGQPPYSQGQQQYGSTQPQYGQPGYVPRYSGATRVTAGVLAIILGSFGVHKFYMGKIGMGILYLLFCWTSIPGIIGLVEGIIYLTKDDDTFREMYCRIS